MTSILEEYIFMSVFMSIYLSICLSVCLCLCLCLSLSVSLSLDLSIYLSIFVKFYLSNHKLCIKSGRHRRPVLPREERICAVCKNNEIEEETHILFSCTLYNTLREQFLTKQQHILNTTFDNYDYWLNILFTTKNKASIRTTACKIYISVFLTKRRC